MKKTEDMNNIDLAKLILLSIDEEITEEQFTLLDRAIAQDQDAAQYYLDIIGIYIGLCQGGNMSAGFCRAGDSSVRDAIKAMQEIENEEFAAGGFREDNLQEGVSGPLSCIDNSESNDLFGEIIEGDLHDSEIRKSLKEIEGKKTKNILMNCPDIEEPNRHVISFI